MLKLRWKQEAKCRRVTGRGGEGREHKPVSVLACAGPQELPETSPQEALALGTGIEDCQTERDRPRSSGWSGTLSAYREPSPDGKTAGSLTGRRQSETPTHKPRQHDSLQQYRSFVNSGLPLQPWKLAVSHQQQVGCALIYHFR